MFDFWNRKLESYKPEPLWKYESPVETEATGSYTVGMTSEGDTTITLICGGVNMTMTMGPEATKEMIRKLTATL
jgi:hypothetical protein